MKNKPISIEYKEPWVMLSFDVQDEWIHIIKNSLQVTDPLYEKKIYIAGRHDFEKLLLVENDSDDNYAIVSIKRDESMRFICSTEEVIFSREELSRRIEGDHMKLLKSYALSES